MLVSFRSYTWGFVSKILPKSCSDFASDRRGPSMAFSSVLLDLADAAAPRSVTGFSALASTDGAATLVLTTAASELASLADACASESLCPQAPATISVARAAKEAPRPIQQM